MPQAWTDAALRAVRQYEGTHYELIPLHRPGYVDKMGRKRGKSPRDNDWRRRPYDPRKVVLECAAEGLNVGVRLGPTDLVVDVDPRNFAEGDDPVARLQADMGVDLGAYPCVVTGSGGLHYYMRKPADVSVRNSLPEYQGVEFKTRGQQVVAAGSTHPDGGMYDWDALSPPPGSAPMAPDALVLTIRRPAAQGKADAGRYSAEQLADMLDALDPCEYGRGSHDRWLELMMACHHATDGLGRSEWVEWCTRDPDYADAAWAVGLRWDSLSSSDSAEARVTYRTLHKALVEAGHGDRVPASDAAEDFGDEVGAGGDGEAWVPPHEQLGPLDRLNLTHWAVDDGGRFRIMYEAEDPTYSPARRYWTRAGKFDFENLLANRRIQKGEGTIPLAKAWMEWGNRRTARGVVFDPERDHPGYLNLWTGWGQAPMRGDWSRLDDLVRDVLCDGNDELAEYVYDWTATLFQRPGRPGETAVCFQGEQGTGKGTFGRALVRLAGRHGLHITSPEHLTGRFNAHLRDVVVLFADEAVSPFDQAATSRLKGLITEPTLTFEGKGVNAETGRNLIHVMMASNEDWFVPASLRDERRFVIQRVSSKRRGDQAYFGALNAQLDAGGLQAFLFDMLRRDVARWRPQGRIPRTLAGMEQRIRAMGPIPAWWFNVLMEGQPPVRTAYAGAPTDADWSRGPIRLFKEDVRAHFDAHCRANGIRSGSYGRALDMAFAEEIQELVGPGMNARAKAAVPGDRPDIRPLGDGRAWCYWLPDLSTCRASMEEHIGGAPGWGEATEGGEETPGADEGW